MTTIDVLLVDDEPQLVRALKPALLAVGYHVSVVENGHDAVRHMATDGADVVLLDLGLPDIDGAVVIERIREWSDTPIVVLSARDNERQKIQALDLGADDYVSKPFAVGELLARLRAVQRGRERRFAASAVVQTTQGLEIDFAVRRVTLLGVEIKLTVREYALLSVLARRLGRIVTREQIAAAVWGADRDEVDPQFLRVLVSQLRSKVEEDSSSPRLILTEPGLGYRLAT